MDGLLFDTESLYWQVGTTLLGRRRREFCVNLQQRMMGRIGVAAIREMIDFHSLSDDAHELLAESDTIFHELLGEGPAPMPGMPELIARLQRMELPFGVATSSRNRFARQILEPQTWFASLAFLLTGDDVTHGKPHPEMYLRAARRLGISPEEMLVFEDSGNGAAAAVAAGACVIAVPNECTRHHPFEGVFAVAESLQAPVVLELLGA